MLKSENKIRIQDYPIHTWYRFVLSFPPHLVRRYIEEFSLDGLSVVLDPFCGTGTTLVECKRLGIQSVGIEANPMAWFASKVKTSWEIDPKGLEKHASEIAMYATEKLKRDGIRDSPNDITQLPKNLRTLPNNQAEMLPKNSISPIPLHKILVLKEAIDEIRDDWFYQFEILALAKIAVEVASNLKFGPEVGIGKIKSDVAVVEPWLRQMREMANHLRHVKGNPAAPAVVHLGDARNVSQFVEPESIDAVITSPPYPNEKDYSRATRLEAVLLGFITSRSDLKHLKRMLVRSNTKTIYNDGDYHKWIKGDEIIGSIANEIEERRRKLNKTSGFEKNYYLVVLHYFGDIYKHLYELRKCLKRGARLAYVVGDQASYFRVLIPTGQIVTRLAKRIGYHVDRIDLFRTRFSTATKSYLKEEVVILSWR